MQFLSNNKDVYHLSEIDFAIRNSDEVFISIAFLKASGLIKILPAIVDLLKRNGTIKIIAGQNFGLTEPKALHSLRKLLQSFKTSKAYIARATKATKIFHPKLYMFRRGSDCTIISGSANITHGGLQNNIECSLKAVCTKADQVWLDANKFFFELIEIENAEEATLLAIKKYESFYERQKAINKKSKAIPDRKKAQVEFDYDNLKKHFLKFDNKKRDQKFEDKTYNYKEAKKVLETIANTQLLAQPQFELLLDSLVGKQGEYGWWHSGSLFRLRRKVYPYYKEFQKLVRYIRDNRTQTPNIVFAGAKKIVKGIEGASVNYVTEIMMTYNNEDFANLNMNPITVLKTEGDVNIKASSESFNELDYAEYCELVKEISANLGLRNMLEADSFFNDIYWRIKKK
jgi:HKD family nuclease